jgi:hypothetical protein
MATRMNDKPDIVYGRLLEATGDEVHAAIESGLPALQTVAAEEGVHALAALAAMTRAALTWVPE